MSQKIILESNDNETFLVNKHVMLTSELIRDVLDSK